MERSKAVAKERNAGMSTSSSSSGVSPSQSVNENDSMENDDEEEDGSEPSTHDLSIHGEMSMLEEETDNSMNGRSFKGMRERSSDEFFSCIYSFTRTQRGAKGAETTKTTTTTK